MINYSSYSNMLSIQTNMCFPFEYNFYKKLGFDYFRDIIEIGCGNAVFLKTLGSVFPNLQLFGYDNCRQLISSQYKNETKLVLKFGSAEDIDIQADAIILRLILHQITDRRLFLAKIKSKINDQTKIIIIDTNDEKFFMTPELPNFNQHLIKHRNFFSSGHASRKVKDFIIQEMALIGFSLAEQESYYMPSSLFGYKEIYKNYFLEGCDVLSCTEEVRNEIESWYLNPTSYVQMGLFMYCFENNKSK